VEPVVTAPVDACPNIDGVQAAVPAGLVKNEAGNCVEPVVAPPVDACPNIDGVQAAVPAGLVKNGAGNCVEPVVAPPVDVCPNISGTQIDLPNGYSLVDGLCVADEVLPAEGEDVCPNIEGVQESVPDGMDKKRGDCVEPAAGEQPKPDQPNKPGQSVVGPDEVLGTEAAQPNAVPTAVDAGIGGGMAVASSSPSNLLGQGLVGGGLMLLILAGALQSGRIGRGAHQF
jgi:hypothetical protein